MQFKNVPINLQNTNAISFISWDDNVSTLQLLLLKCVFFKYCMIIVDALGITHDHNHTYPTLKIWETNVMLIKFRKGIQNPTSPNQSWTPCAESAC